MPLVTAIVSWAIAFFTAKRVALKNTRKQAFIDLLNVLDNLEEAAESLLLVSGDDPSAHALFRSVCQRDRRMGRRMQELFVAHRSKRRLAGSDPVPPRVSDAKIALRKIAVADELVSAGRPACTGTDQKFHALTACVEQLRNELRDEADDMGAGDLQP
jgi:hypothetical protein